jgi:hypothetical protein
MTKILSKTKPIVWIIPVVILLAGVVIVALAPDEQTLGSVIKYVYVHVAFTRAGMIGFYIAGLLGLIVVVTGRRPLQSWAQTIGWVALAWFIIGGIVSILAQQNSWGGTPWNEPRNMTSLNIIALSVIVQIWNGWMPSVRLRGVLYVTLALFVAWSIPNTPLILHPAEAISSSSSLLIPLTFTVLTGLCLLLGAWLVWYWAD